MVIFDADFLDTPSDIMGGFDRVAYLALAGWIVDWPKLAQNPQTDEEFVTLAGQFVMVPGASFIKISGRSGLTAEPQGARDSASVHCSGQLFRAGTHAENIALQRKLNGAYGVIIFTNEHPSSQPSQLSQPSPEDSRTVLGDSIHPCFFTVKADYGTNAADSKGIIINYEFDGFVAGYAYSGDIPTLDNVVAGVLYAGGTASDTPPSTLSDVLSLATSEPITSPSPFILNDPQKGDQFTFAAPKGSMTVCIVLPLSLWSQLSQIKIFNADFGYFMEDQFTMHPQTITINDLPCAVYYYTGLIPFSGPMTLQVTL